MPRILKEGVLEAFCKYAEGTEVPGTFALWSGISLVSAVLGRDGWIDYGFFSVYPNMYIALVAKSALCRKSTSVNMALNFMQKVKPKVKILAQRMTSEALISALSGTNIKDENTIAIDAVGVIIADELITFIDKNAFQSGLITTLTKLYDCTDYDYETISRKNELVRNPCLSLHGGCIAHALRDAVPIAAIECGFTARVVFVYQDKTDRDIDWPVLTPENAKRGEDIVHDLNEIAKMRGAFAFTVKARKIWKEEYSRFKHGSKLYEIPVMSGYAGRRHTTLLKTCMIISASKGNSRSITEHDIGIAIRALSAVENDMPQVLSTIKREFVGDVAYQTLEIIMRRGVIGRPELVKLMSDQLSSRQLDIILETLMESKRIEQTSDGGRKIRYAFIGVKK